MNERKVPPEIFLFLPYEYFYSFIYKNINEGISKELILDSFDKFLEIIKIDNEDYYNFYKLLLWPLYNVETKKLKNKSYSSFGINVSLIRENLDKYSIVGVKFKNNKLYEIILRVIDSGVKLICNNKLIPKKIIFLDNTEIKIK